MSESLVEFDAFLPDIIPDMPDEIPEGLILQAVRNACIAFCKRTGYWRETLAAQTLVEGQSTYSLPTNGMAQITDIVSVTAGDAALVSGDGVMEGTYYQESPHSITISVPTYEGSLVVRAKLAPARSGHLVAKVIHDRYSHAVASGAKANVFAMNQPWGNPGLAGAHMSDMEKAISDAKQEADKGFSTNPVYSRRKYKFY
jgi:hypothetical protein